MTRVAFFLLCLVALLGASFPAFAAEEAEDSSIVSLRTKTLDFMEEPVVYESTNVSIEIHASLRFRVEDFDHFDNYYYGSEEDRDNYMSSRLTFGLEYNVKEIFTFGLEFIDSRVYSFYMEEEPSNLDNPLDLNRAWIELKTTNYPFSFEIGRDYLTIASGKLIGKSEWDNVPWRFETVKLGITQEKWNIYLAYAKPVFPDKENTDQATLRENHDWFGDINDDFKYGSIWGGYTFSEKFSLNAYVICKIDDNRVHLASESESYDKIDNLTAGGTESFGDHRVYSYGIWTYGRIQDFEYDLDLTMQGGNKADEDIKAWNIDVAVKWAPENEYKPFVSIGYCVASGDDDSYDDELNTFDPMYGTFNDNYGIIRAISPRNVKIFMFKSGVTPVKNFSIGLDFFLFERAESEDAWYNAAGDAYLDDVFDSKTIGSEIDVLATYSFSKFSKITAGLGFFFGSDMLEDAGLEERIKLFFISYQIEF